MRILHDISYRLDGVSALRLTAIGAAVVFLTFITVRFGQQLQADGVSVFWPAAGVITCFIVFTGNAVRTVVLLSICLGCALGNLYGQRPFLVFLLFLGGNLSHPYLLLFLRDHALQSFPVLRRDDSDTKTLSPFLFGVLAVIAVAAIGVIMALCLRWSGVAQGSFIPVWGQWIFSNLTGIAVVAPLAFLFMAWLKSPVESRTFENALAMDLPWTVRQRLIMLVAVFAIPMMLLIVGAVAYFAQLTRENQYKSLEFATRSLAQAVDAQLSQYILLAKTLAQSPSLLEDDLSAFRAEAARAFPDPDKTWVVVSDTQYKQLFNQRAGATTALSQRSEAARIGQDKAFASRSMQVSDGHYGTVSKRWIATVEMPVFVNGKPFRCLTITMDLREFFQLLNAKEVPDGWVAGIADSQGRFIARVPDNDARVGKPVSADWRASLRQEGVTEVKTIEGDPVINSNANSKVSEWTIALGAKKSLIEAPAWQAIRWALLLGLGAAFACVMFAAWVARSIINPVERLGASASALVSGQPATYSTRLPEAAQLWTSLEAAVTEREKTFADLLRSQAESSARAEEIQTLYQCSPIGLAVLDLNACFIRVNDALAKITGHSAQDHLGRAVWDVVPSMEATVKRLLDEVLKSGKASNEIEVTAKAKHDESLRFWVTSFYPLQTEGGFVAAVGMTLRDVTAEKQALEQIKLLIDEVNHRSKNLLAVVQSVAYHTAKDGNPAIFAQRLMDRIAGLSRSQDLLVDSNWRDVNLLSLLERQLPHFKDAFGCRIQFHGPQVQLTAAATQTLGMAFNELATNAAKYGALSNERGLIRVDWHFKANGSAPKLCIKWTEAEGPAVQPPTRKGFGHTVMVRMVEQSLDADVQLSYDAAGVVWEMTAPASEVLSRLDPIPGLYPADPAPQTLAL